MALVRRTRGTHRRALMVGPLLIAAVVAPSSSASLARPLLAQAVRAQPASVTGVVRDSATGAAISGAVVQLRDSLDHSITEVVTDERGQYRLAGVARARTLRVLHMGFRPAGVSLIAGGTPPREIALAAVPPLLAPVRVSTSARCPKQTNTAASLGLLDQVRAGLLATVIAGTQQPRTLTVLSYEREYAPGRDDHNSDRGEGSGIARQSVHRRSESAVEAPFGASRTGAAFVADGFRQDSSGAARYFAPDATTLVDDDFAAGYCFRVVAADAYRPHQIGLGFTAPRRRDGRIDLDGVLWVDTVSRTLHDLTFQYVGLPARVTALHPGGQLSFREMPTGVAYIDRWSLRLVSGGDASGDDERRRPPVSSSAYGSPDYGAPSRPTTPLAVREIGGELARVTWSDGRTWAAPLGSWRLHVVDQHGHPAAGAVVTVAQTDYSGTADSAGVVELRDILPGPYTASVSDPVLSALGRGHAIEQHVVATRDSSLDTRVTVEMADRVMALRTARPDTARPGISVLQRSRDSLAMARNDGKSIESLLTGRFPGVVVTQAADGTLHIRIRGAIATVGNDAEPLYVLDGSPMTAGAGGLSFLNPADIDKIEVLKNAQDIGVYGLRGSNGVILITTKRPGRR